MNILVAVEDREYGEFLQKTLENGGYNVSTTFDGAEAFRLMDSSQFDAFVVDMDLPGMKGLTIARAIIGLKKEKLSGMILITGQSNIETSLTAMDSGIRDILKKTCQHTQITVPSD